ncbi:ABC transporter ATP-binding protein [Actinomycetes bacterium KLBMP 9759]
MHEQPLTARRLAGPGSTFALVALVVSAAAETAGAVVAGQVAAFPTAASIGVLAVLLLGSSVLESAGRVRFSAVVGKAEGRLRSDLLDAALHQPLRVLDDQAVGEVLDRVDDDTRQVGHLLRRTGWELGRGVVRSVLAWVAGGLTWWPAWFAFPLVAFVAWVVVRRLTPVVASLKHDEEAAWSDHSAQLEEAVAGRDDVRSSLGQPHVVRQYALRAAEVLRKVQATCVASTAVGRRTGLVMNGMLTALAVGGVAIVGAGALGVAELVTLWLLVTTFAGQLSNVTNRLPEVQAGIGALTRIRSMLDAEREPVGGVAVPAGPAAVEFRGVTFGYPGGFTLQSVDVSVPAGTTCALVGRTGGGKSTLAKLVSRAVEPPPGTVFVGGQDVTTTDIDDLRRAVGVVTQRTEMLAATLAENITLFADVPEGAVERAVEALGLADWVASLPEGLDTRLGVEGTTLSAGEEQLVAFARLLVRDVAVVVLDEATARMDPQTERRVTHAAERLLAGRTGIVIAHRLSTTRRCDTVVVLDHGRVLQQGDRARLAVERGPFRELLAAAGEAPPRQETGALVSRGVRRQRRQRLVPHAVALARTVVRLCFVRPRWGLAGAVCFLLASLLGAYGAVTGWLWGGVVAGLQAGGVPWPETVALGVSLLLAPVLLAHAIRIYPQWWSEVTLRMRLSVLRGQTMQRRLARTPPGEVVARSLDSDRLVMYADRWVDVVNGVVVVLVAALAGRSLLAGAVIGGMLVLCAVVCAMGAPIAGSSAREAGDARAAYGGSLVSVLESARTVKLAAATEAAQAHLGKVDAVRVAASIREQRVRVLLDGVPGLLIQLGVVLTWALHLVGTWDLATALLVTTTLNGAGWFGMVFGAAVTEAPVARRWLQAMSDLAGGTDLLALPDGVDLRTGAAPAPPAVGRVPLKRLRLEGVSAVHDDGTVGAEGVDLDVDAGSLVLLTGRVGAGKSSLLASLAGLVDHEGSILWNDEEIDDPQLFLRPGQVAYVGQVPRVLSGTFTDNIALDHERSLDEALRDARMATDVRDAGGHGALVGHRGVRLSGGQVQRLALARALATEAELLIADDVSSALDARTEIELWEALRDRGVTVVGCSSKQSALARADTVVVLEGGRVAETGPWSHLAERWGHLAG